MGANDSAEVAELVGLMLLWDIRELIPEIQFGLYRDDGLGVMKTGKGCHTENIKKKLIKIFKENELKIDIKMRLQKADFLDVTFDLYDGTYKPYKKPNDRIMYINKNSNHPMNVIKQIPEMVQSRLTTISKNKNTFNDSIPEYERALMKSGFKTKLIFDEKIKAEQEKRSTTRENIENKETEQDKNEKKKHTKNRKRQVTWFNPPFNSAVEQNIGKCFLRIIDKYFGKPRKDNLHKIFNRKTLKLGYSCTTNFKNIIQNHNNKILQNKQKNTENTPTCNCKRKDECPLDNKECNISAVVYSAEVEHLNEETENTEKAIYIGSTEGNFKLRLYNHKTDQKYEKNKNKTTLAHYIWNLKNQNKTFKIKWKILKKCRPFKNNAMFVILKKTFILLARRRKENILNSKLEYMNPCKHRYKHLLESIKTQ